MEEIAFTPTGEFIELHQLLKVTGVCDSGGAGKALVASGAVSVDGCQELRKTAKIQCSEIHPMVLPAASSNATTASMPWQVRAIRRRSLRSATCPRATTA